MISRTSVLDYRDGQRKAREIGRELGADAILEGGVQRVGDQIRINAQLIDASSDGHLWARQYDREVSPANMFEVQSELARLIASALHVALTEQDAIQLKVLPTENMAAYRAYHEAMELRDTETIGAPAYIAALERAVALDPDFVRAWAELAGSLSYVNIRRQDPDSIRRARGLDPRNPYWTTRLVSSLMFVHRYDEAIEELENTTVDSFNLSVLHGILRVRDHPEPGRLLENLTALEAEYGEQADPFALWEVRIATRDYAAAAAALLDAVQTAEHPADAWTVSDIPDLDLARAVTDSFPGTPAGTGAALAAAVSAAVDCLRSGLAEPSQVMPFIEPSLPCYDAIRNEPEFVAQLKEIQAR